jgi:hypothetical protein
MESDEWQTEPGRVAMTVERTYKLYPDSLGIQHASSSARHFISSKTTSLSIGSKEIRNGR